jgi:proteasome lid subunit RPN8/RPN11
MQPMRISAGDLLAIREHASRGYPEEICGMLIGRDADGWGRVIARVLSIDNSREDERGRRYVITADALRGAERTAANDGLDVVGFYHSHPDHPAEPSAYDREHAWPWYTYMIVPVAAGAAGEPRAWQLREDRTGFEEIRLESEHGD